MGTHGTVILRAVGITVELEYVMAQILVKMIVLQRFQRMLQLVAWAHNAPWEKKMLFDYKDNAKMVLVKENHKLTHLTYPLNPQEEKVPTC